MKFSAAIVFHHLDSATLIKITRFYFFWRKCCHFDFRQGMGFTRIVKKIFERNCENWSENEFTSFGENAITLIFARGWDSLGLSKKTVKKSAKIGQKLNSLLLSKMPSLQFSTMEGIHYNFRKKWWKKRRKLVRKWILYPTSVKCKTPRYNVKQF